jgi:hypothetical protein
MSAQRRTSSDNEIGISFSRSANVQAFSYGHQMGGESGAP